MRERWHCSSSWKPLAPFILEQIFESTIEDDRQVDEVAKRRVRHPARLKPLIRRATQTCSLREVLLAPAFGATLVSESGHEVADR